MRNEGTTNCATIISYHIIIGVQGHLGSYQFVADGGHTTKKLAAKRQNRWIGTPAVIA